MRSYFKPAERRHTVQFYIGGQYHKPRLGSLRAHACWGRFKASGSLPPIRYAGGSSRCLPMDALDRVTPGNGPDRAHEPGRGIIEMGSQP